MQAIAASGSFRWRTRCSRARGSPILPRVSAAIMRSHQSLSSSSLTMWGTASFDWRVDPSISAIERASSSGSLISLITGSVIWSEKPRSDTSVRSRIHPMRSLQKRSSFRRIWALSGRFIMISRTPFRTASLPSVSSSSSSSPVVLDDPRASSDLLRTRTACCCTAGAGSLSSPRATRAASWGAVSARMSRTRIRMRSSSSSESSATLLRMATSVRSSADSWTFASER